MKLIFTFSLALLLNAVPAIAQSGWSLGVEAGYLNPIRVLGNHTYSAEGITLGSNNPYAEALRFAVFGERQLSSRWSAQMDLGLNYFTYNNKGLYSYEDVRGRSQLGTLPHFGEVRLSTAYEVLPGVKLMAGLNNWIFQPYDEPEGHFIDLTNYPERLRSEAIQLNRRREAAIALQEGSNSWLLTAMAGLRLEYGRVGVALHYERSLTPWMNGIELFDRPVGLSTHIDRFSFTLSYLLVKNR